MSVLFAVKSCCQDWMGHSHQAIRETWGKNLINLVFFMGNGSRSTAMPERDEKFLNVPDGYDDLPFKTREILRWSIEHLYDYVFLCDVDSFVIPSKLLKSGFEKYDYFGINGRTWGQPFIYNAVDRHGQDHVMANCLAWCSGGYGYFVSRRAAQYIVTQEPNIWAEDLWVGQVLGRKGDFKMGNMTREVSTWHAPRGLSPQGVQKWLKDMYEAHGS